MKILIKLLYVTATFLGSKCFKLGLVMITATVPAVDSNEIPPKIIIQFLVNLHSACRLYIFAIHSHKHFLLTPVKFFFTCYSIY
jgi:hypothetical protein